MCLRRKLLVLLAAAILSWPLAPVEAQWPASRLNRNRIPASAFASGTVFPRELATNETFDLFPREIVTAWGKAEFGFDPMLLDRATLFVVPPEMVGAVPRWSAVLEFSEIQGVSGDWIDRLQRRRLGERSLFSGTGRGLPSCLVMDETTLLVGDESLFSEMLESNGTGGLAQRTGQADGSGIAIVVADLEPIRPLLNELAGQLPPVLPPAITRLQQLPDLLRGMEFQVDVKDQLRTRLMMHFESADAAESSQKILQDALDLGVQMILAGASSQFSTDDPVQRAALAYLQRMSGEYRDRISPVLDDDKLVIELEDDVAASPILIGLLLPAAQQAREAARRTSSMNNQRQMALAAHNYSAVHNHFPAQANYDDRGRPLLSWRVHILPYIDQQELYDQFHLDEPWDSAHNRQLIERMPRVFISPSVGDLRGKTVYLGVAGENGVFGPEPRSFADITDGSSNTVMAVEVDPSEAVEWTRPVDYELDPERPTKGLGAVLGNAFLATFADGSVRAIPSNIDPEQWKAMTTINGGEVNRE